MPRALVVDDVVEIARFVAAVVEEADLTAAVATSYQEAVAALDDSVTLVIIDIAMPGRSRARAVRRTGGVDIAPGVHHPRLHAVADGGRARRLLPEAYTVLYVADSWRVVRDDIDAISRWLPFVDNWVSDAFGQYVAYLESEVDALAADAGAEERARMADLFELTTRYEIAFWEMAVSGEMWSGIPEEDEC